MAKTVPWSTTSDLISAIKRKISFPVYQSTFSEQDLIDFLNEEMFISQVPSIMEYHEEYLVYRVQVPLKANQSRYPIPYRAIGMKLRDLFFIDNNGSLFEMARVMSDDKAYFQQTYSTGDQTAYKYYIEGNDIVLTPGISAQVPTGAYLTFGIFIRPNQLVTNDRAAIIQSFTKTITVDNTLLVAGNTVTIDSTVFTAVTGAAGALQFQINASSVVTAANLAAAISQSGTIDGADNGTPGTNIVRLYYPTLDINLQVSNTTACVIQTSQGILFASDMPSVFTEGSMTDILQEKPGHQIYKFDVKIPIGGIFSTRIINFPVTSLQVPTSSGVNVAFIALQAGDYICLANEAIIPQIPPDLHNVLAERACARVLAAIGDQAGLASSNQKIAEMEKRTGTLVDSRVDGSPLKITNRRSFLHFNRRGSRF